MSFYIILTILVIISIAIPLYDLKKKERDTIERHKQEKRIAEEYIKLHEDD